MTSHFVALTTAQQRIALPAIHPLPKKVCAVLPESFEHITTII